MSARPGQLGGVACERLFRFAGTWPNLVLSNPCTFHDGSTALFGGSLGIDGFGGIGGVMLAVGPQRYLHTVAWELAGTCAIQEIGDPGSANLTDAGPRGLRVGDFTQTARDPSGDWLWAIGQYAAVVQGLPQRQSMATQVCRYATHTSLRGYCQ